MTEPIMTVKCSTCGRVIRFKEQDARQVLEGKTKCPHCGVLLQAEKRSVTWNVAGPTRGEELETGKNALLRLRRHQQIAIASFATPSLRDLLEIGRFEKELEDILDKHGLQNVVLNFSDLKFMSSSVLGVLVRFQGKLKAAGGMIVLCSVAPEILNVFKITRVGELFEFRHSEGDAIRVLMRRL